MKEKMIMNFENLSKKGLIITVHSSTRDGGKSDYPNGWNYPIIENRYNPNLETCNIPHLTFKKILKLCKYKKVFGGFSDGKLIHTCTRIQII